MSSKTKKTFIFALFGLLIAGGVFVYHNLGGWVRTEAQRIASEAAGVDVTIGSIDVAFRDKTIEVKSIKVANPKGFSGHAFTLGNIRIQAEQLSREKIVLKEVVATNEFVNLEVDGTRVNLRELLKGVQARSGSTPKSSPSAKAPQVVIKELRIEKGRLNSSLGLMSKKTSQELSIPTIRMNNLGQGKSSSNADEVAGKIIQENLNKSLQAAAQQGLVESTLKDLGGSVKDTATGLKDKLLR
jgi:hypothetical protein